MNLRLDRLELSIKCSTCQNWLISQNKPVVALLKDFKEEKKLKSAAKII